MHKSMNLLVLKHKFKQKLLNLLASFWLIFTNCVDFKVGFP